MRADILRRPHTRYPGSTRDKEPFLEPPDCSRSHQVRVTYPCRTRVLRTPDNWGMWVFVMRRSNRRSPRSLGPPMLATHLPAHLPAHLKGRLVHSGCSSPVEAAASQGRKAELPPKAPYYCRMAEGSNNLAEVASSDMADYNKWAEAEAEAA